MAKFIDKLPAFVLGAVVAVAAMFGVATWQSNFPFGFATTKEVEELRSKIVGLDQALRDSEAKMQAEIEQKKRAEAARAADLAAIKAGDVAKLKEAQEAARRAELDAKRQADLVRQREVAVIAAREAARIAAEDARRAERAKIELRQEGVVAPDATSRAKRERLAEEELARKARISQGTAPARTDPPAAQSSGKAMSRSEREQLADEEAARKALAAAGKVPAGKPAESELDTLYQQALAMESAGNAKDAIRIYRRAARAGSGKAAKRLGDIFFKGAPDVARDYAESLQWYETARQLGEPVETAGM